MAKLVTIIFFGFFALSLAKEGLGLACLKCKSTDVNSKCRFGARSDVNRKQVCREVNAACFAVASVDEDGSAYFHRGCTTQNVCRDRDDTEIEFCKTCKSNYCNYNVMVLDQEVEDYLNETRKINQHDDSIINKNDPGELMFADEDVASAKSQGSKIFGNSNEEFKLDIRMGP